MRKVVRLKRVFRIASIVFVVIDVDAFFRNTKYNIYKRHEEEMTM